jgi:hypothetical protein
MRFLTGLLVALAILLAVLLIGGYDSRADTRCHWLSKEWVCDNGQQRVTCYQVGKQWVCRET